MPRNQHKDKFEAEAWLKAHGVKLTGGAIGGREVCEAFAPVGLRVLAAIDYIGGLLVYHNRGTSIRDWQNPPRAAFLRSAA